MFRFKKHKPKTEIISSSQDVTSTKDCKKLILDNVRWERRLQKELMSLIKEPRPGVQVDTDSVGQNLTQWKIHMAGVPGTLYDGENFQLLFKFNNKYPFDSPEVTFVGPNIPIHPHIYSNGHICLSILTEDWTPALSVQSVCLSISSMLSSCREKKRPADNTLYVKTCNKNPKKTKWWYHVACETSGIIGSVGLALLKKIGSMIARVTHEKRATTYLLQRIAVAIQRGNVASIMGTIPPSKNLGEIFYL